MVRAVRRSGAVFSAELDGLDAVWVFGPHPMALLFAGIARARGTRLVLGVRQDYPRYIAGRLPGRGWAWAVPAARALDAAFRGLARSAPTVALGDELAARYAAGRAPVLSTGFSLVREAELADPGDAAARPWGDALTLLSVGRLDPEKNPLLLLDVIEGLRRRDPRWRLVAAGDGPLRDELAAQVAARGLAGVVELPGEVPNGPALWDLYRRSHAFLHVSFTEGLPQVLFEAQAAGVPIVATAVGGVPSAVDGGRTGLLIGPGDAGAAIAAVERLASDAELRRRLVVAARAEAGRETLEAQRDRVVDFFEAGLGLESASRGGGEPRGGPAGGGRHGAARGEGGRGAGQREQQPEVAFEGERQE
jgi:glycosyltransferase involved in cell wall biosynthesis